MKNRWLTVGFIFLFAWWAYDLGWLNRDRYLVTIIFLLEMMLAFHAGWLARKGTERWRL